MATSENRHLRRALEVLNAYLLYDASQTDVYENAIRDNLAEPNGPRELVTGVVELTGIVLQEIKIGSDVSPEAILKKIAHTLDVGDFPRKTE